MESPKGIKIPEHWLINTDIIPRWPHKEGIWMNDEGEVIFCLVCVYQALIDIPEASNHLAKCNEQFLNNYAAELLSFINSSKQTRRAGGNITAAGAPLTSEIEAEKITAIYRPWVDTWALGSDKMLQLVVGINTTEIIFNMLGFSSQELRHLSGNLDKLTDIGNSACVPWVWKTLIGSQYKRVEYARRELARRTAQSNGFYRRDEVTGIVRARWWVIVRIFKWTESQLIQKLDLDRFVDSVSHDIDSIDKALGFDRTPGAPMGKQRGVKEEDTIRDITEYERKLHL